MKRLTNKVQIMHFLVANIHMCVHMFEFLVHI